MKKMPTMLTWLQSVNNCEMINVAGYDQPYFKQLDLFKINKSNHIIAKHELILDRLLLLFLICKLISFTVIYWDYFHGIQMDLHFFHNGFMHLD